IGLIGLLSIFLAACSPDYNWRQVSVGDGVATAFFPDKPVTQERTLSFLGHDVVFSLTSATVGDALFAVAHAPLPEALRADASMRQAFAKAVIGSLYRNLGVQAPEPLPAFGTPFMIQGKGPQGPMQVQARVWLTDHTLIEGLVTAGQDV